MTSNERLTLRVDECAAALGISRGKAYSLVASGALPSLRFGKTIVVPLTALRRFIDETAVPVADESADVRAAGARRTADKAARWVDVRSMDGPVT